MSRFDTRSVRVLPAAGLEPFELRCLWIPRSGGKVLAIWRIGGAPQGATVTSEGDRWVVRRVAPHDAITEAATLERVL